MTNTKKSESYADRISNEIYIPVNEGCEKRNTNFLEKALIFDVVSTTIESIEYSIADSFDTYGNIIKSISEEEKRTIITASANTAERIIQKFLPYADTVFSIYFPITEYFEIE